MKDSNGQIHLVPSDVSPAKRKSGKKEKRLPVVKKGSNSNSKMEVIYSDNYNTSSVVPTHQLNTENVINYKDVGKNITKFKRLEKEIENEYLQMKTKM